MMQLAYDTVSLLGGEGGYDADHRAYSRCDQAGGRICFHSSKSGRKNIIYRTILRVICVLKSEHNMIKTLLCSEIRTGINI